MREPQYARGEHVRVGSSLESPGTKTQVAGLGMSSFTQCTILGARSPVLKCFHLTEKKPATSLSHQSPATDKHRPTVAHGKSPLCTSQVHLCITACLVFIFIAEYYFIIWTDYTLFIHQISMDISFSSTTGLL